MVSPVIHAASSDARYTISDAISSGCPGLPSGCVPFARSRKLAYAASSRPLRRCRLVTTTPVDVAGGRASHRPTSQRHLCVCHWLRRGSTDSWAVRRASAATAVDRSPEAPLTALVTATGVWSMSVRHDARRRQDAGAVRPTPSGCGSTTLQNTRAKTASLPRSRELPAVALNTWCPIS